MKRPKNMSRNVMRSYYYLRNMMRVKHYRGFGVHSPFVYGLVRHSVMMKKNIIGEECAVFDKLVELKVAQKRAVQLQNMCNWAGYTKYFFLTDADSELGEMDEHTVYFVLPSYPLEKLPEVCTTSEGKGGVVCLLSPYESRTRSKACKALIKIHRNTSVDNRGYLLIFFNPRHPKQHFKL